MIKQALLLFALLAVSLAITDQDYLECASELEYPDFEAECEFEVSDESSLESSSSGSESSSSYEDTDNPCYDLDENSPQTLSEDWSDDYGKQWHECQNFNYQQFKEYCSDKVLQWVSDHKECGGDFGVPLDTGDDNGSSFLQVSLALAALVTLIF